MRATVKKTLRRLREKMNEDRGDTTAGVIFIIIVAIVVVVAIALFVHNATP